MKFDRVLSVVATMLATTLMWWAVMSAFGTILYLTWQIGPGAMGAPPLPWWVACGSAGAIAAVVGLVRFAFWLPRIQVNVVRKPGIRGAEYSGTIEVR